MRYWLMKSEPTSFSIDDLAKRPQQTEPWDGVRNYQARNFIKEMQANDLAFFYHSSCEIPGIAGIVKIVTAPYPDKTAFNPESKYYDPKSTTANPRWYRVDVKLDKKFNSIISLQILKQYPELYEMHLMQTGSRLSVMPVNAKQWEVILQLSS